MNCNNIVRLIDNNQYTPNLSERMVWNMSISLPVQVSKDHLSKYKKCPTSLAIAEFIWNSVDADAHNVYINFQRNDLGNIDSISIADDGHGIVYDELEETFGQFGSTYKKYRVKSPEGRFYHGKQGHGRYKGFSLGDRIIWDSSYKDKENRVFDFTILGDNNDLDKYIIVEKTISNSNKHGTTATIERVNEACSRIDTLKIATELEIIFAPYLLAYPGINIYIDNNILDPKNSMVKIESKDIVIPNDGENPEINAEVKIIEWKTGKNKNRYLCNSSGMALAEEPSGIRATMFSHTIYIMSDFFDNLLEENMLELREHFPNYLKLADEVEKITRKYYRNALAKSAEDVIKELKTEGVYPYKEQASNEIEKVEREVFDICAANVNQYLSGFKNSPKSTKTFTLNLLKETVEQNPTSMKKILDEVLKLPSEKVEELAELLEKTNLSSIISTTKMIADRLSFINGFEQILFATDLSKKLKERSQLHKILLNELWIFGEQYNYGCDDISLKNVLVQHLKILSRTDLAKEVKDADLKGLDDIPDICIYKQYTTGRPDEFENLVIELKRPSVPLGAEELTQIENYAFAVADTKYFDKDKTKWTFIIIGTKLEEYAKRRCNQPDRPHGCITKLDKIEIWVKEWNQIMQEAKGRHNFLKERLNYTITDNSDGMNYLQSKYEKLLPDQNKISNKI